MDTRTLAHAEAAGIVVDMFDRVLVEAAEVDIDTSVALVDTEDVLLDQGGRQPNLRS